MCNIVEGLVNNKKREIALRLLKNGKLFNEEIAKSSGLAIEVIKTHQREMKAVVL